MDYESILQRVYESFLLNGDVVIDVGAHVGRHTFPIVNLIAPLGKVYAVEPLTMGQDSIRNSINLEQQQYSSNIQVFPYALSDYEGESEFLYVVNNPGYSGLLERTYDENVKLEKITVPVKKIDNVFSQLPSLRYIKIDAEGGEFNILKGASNTIKKFRPIVTFEFGASSYAAYEVIPEEVFQFWSELDYSVFNILGIKLENEDAFAKSSINQHIWDYIAIPTEDTASQHKVLRAITSWIE